ncbi:homeobox protein Mohawk [Cloeon dipterum]|uniref:homeobox protein Mohawk n=1 Tax=Cloeon dipterum TaxID=197152 RepID=UPI00321F9217
MVHVRRTKRAKPASAKKASSQPRGEQRLRKQPPSPLRMPSDRVLRARKANSSICRHLLMGFVGRPPKRLFTPEIKRKLKDWLVKRRRNPYPTREEKQALARETGLEYSQICNWFANWRRKLKNAEAAEDPAESDISMDSEPRVISSWGRRILIYNNVAARNAEKIPVNCGTALLEDSDQEMELSCGRLTSSSDSYNPTVIDHCYSMTPMMVSEMDKNGNYCRSNSNKQWIWNLQDADKTRPNSDTEMEDAEAPHREAEIEAAVVLATLGTA